MFSSVGATSDDDDNDDKDNAGLVCLCLYRYISSSTLNPDFFTLLTTSINLSVFEVCNELGTGFSLLMNGLMPVRFLICKNS